MTQQSKKIGGLTDQECPVCGAETGGGYEVIDYNPPNEGEAGGHPWQQLKCDECGSTWQVEYSVTAVDNIVRGKLAEEKK